MKHLFLPILIPAGIDIHKGTTRALFTVWFQLNASNSIFVNRDTAPMPQPEYSAITGFTRQLNNIKDITITTGGQSLTATPVLNKENKVVSSAGLQFYEDYFARVVSMNTLAELDAADLKELKFTNEPKALNSPVRSVLFQEAEIGPMNTGTSISTLKNSIDNKIDGFIKLQKGISSFSQSVVVNNRGQRRKQIEMLLNVASRKGKNRISGIDDLVTLSPAYVMKAFNTLGNNTYIQHLTGLFTKVAIDFNELKKLFVSGKPLSMLVTKFTPFNESSFTLNELCLPSGTDANPPTCVRLIKNQAETKFAILLHTYSNDITGGGYFPYDQFFYNSVLTVVNEPEKRANTLTYEEISRLYSQRHALADTLDMIKSHGMTADSFSAMLAQAKTQIRNIEDRRPAVAASGKDDKLLRAIVYLESYAKRAKVGDDMVAAVNAADEKPTTGLSLVHPQWHNLIKPDKDLDCLYEHTLTKGYAVAIEDGHSDDKNFVSLTRRKEFLTIHKSGTTTVNEDDGIYHGTVSGDSLMNAMQPIQSQASSPAMLVTDNVLFTWLGTTLGLKDANQGHENDEEANEDGNVDDVDLDSKVLADRTADIFETDYFPFLKRKNLPAATSSHYFLNYGIDAREKSPRLLFSRSRDYHFLFYAQYINGWQLPLQQELGSTTMDVQLTVDEVVIPSPEKFIFPGKFLRNEHIKNVRLFLGEELGLEKGPNFPGKEGESLEHIVIRSTKGGYVSSQVSSRHILPPEITPIMARWHGCFQQGKMSVQDVYQWHLKYHCLVDDAKKFATNGCTNGCKNFCGNHTMQQFYKDKNIAPHYLTDPLAEGFAIHFFRDEECSISAVQYGYDSQTCYFKNGTFPAVRSWKLVLRDDQRAYRMGTKLVKDDIDQELTVFVPQGLELYAKIITLIRTINDDAVVNALTNPAVSRENSEFMTDLTGIMANQQRPGLEFTAMNGVVSFETYAQKIILTHAVKQPLMRPVIKQVEFTKWLPQPLLNGGTGIRTRSSVKATVTLQFEMLNTVKNELPGAGDQDYTYINGTQPTGDIEIWGKWEDYADNPKISYRPLNAGDLEAFRELHSPVTDPLNSLEDSRNEFKLLGKVKFEEKAHGGSIMHKELERLGGSNNLDFTVFQTKVNVDFDIEKNQATDFVLLVKNASRFNGYFTTIGPEDKTQFQLVSEPFLSKIPDDLSTVRTSYIEDTAKKKIAAVSSFYLNNQKPGKPIVSRIVPLVVSDDTKLKGPGKDFTRRTTRYNRFRIFFKRNLASRLVAARDEQLGIIIDSPTKSYNPFFRDNEFTARIGTDWITEIGLIAGNNTWLEESHFQRSHENMEDYYLAKYKPTLFQDNFMDMLLYSFRFDAFRNNWFCDVEINFRDDKGNEYHNPFIQLGLVNFYRAGINYSNDKTADLVDDYRLSDPAKSGFLSLLPSRTITARMYAPNLFRKNGYVEFSLDCNMGSLFYDKDGGLRSRIFAGIRQCYRDIYTFIPSINTRATIKKMSLFHDLLDKDLATQAETIDGNKVAEKMVSLEFARNGIFGHKYELVLVEFENFLPDYAIDLNNKDFFKMPGHRIKYIEIF